MEATRFGRLTGLRIGEGATEGSMSWEFTDADGREASFAVDGSGIGIVFQTLIALLEKMGSAKVPGEPEMTLSALPAQNISITAGRNPKEVSLHVHVGGVDLAYLVPLDSIVITMGELVSKLYTDPPKPGFPTH
jgi:hypothetical protein